MNTRGIIGRRIVAVRQRQFVDRTHGRLVDVEAIILDDGTELRPVARESELDGYPVDMHVLKPT